MIVETLVTTVNADGSPNIAPMGPWIDSTFERFELRPFCGSRTGTNLSERPQGVINITDDVLLYAQAVTGNWIEAPPLTAADSICGWRLEPTIAWYEFEVTYVDTSSTRLAMSCRTTSTGTGPRNWSGFCRAQFAVIECAILATRVDFLNPAEIKSQFERFQTMIAKTGGKRETQALQILADHLREKNIVVNDGSIAK